MSQHCAVLRLLGRQSIRRCIAMIQRRKRDRRLFLSSRSQSHDSSSILPLRLRRWKPKPRVPRLTSAVQCWLNARIESLSDFAYLSNNLAKIRLVSLATGEIIHETIILGFGGRSEPNGNDGLIKSWPICFFDYQ